MFVYVKANLDAAVKENVVTGMGLFIFRHHEGQILAATVKSFRELLFPCDAEAPCLLWTLKLASDLCFTHIEIESECLELVNAFNNNSQVFLTSMRL
ncbi:hypothetical protein RIF29_19403 [Crotalaria pallida]|uniref:RNase H type-1 domain-containing protein n=1 Tax=Crotalaria pallida TaxID=3830 RepID=A0AAN9F175_CROPI